MDLITSTRILLAEGKDEVNFFRALLRHMDLDGVQVTDVAGKTKFRSALAAAALDPDFGKVERLVYIRDADSDPNSAFQSAKNDFEHAKLPAPRRPGILNETGSPLVGVYIMPGSLASGMLEDLCLHTVLEHPVAVCVEQFLACVCSHTPGPRELSKAKAQAFLAGMPEIVGSVGVAALKGYWEFNHQCLDDVKRFIWALAS